MAEIEFRMLGPLEAVRSGRRVELGTGRQRKLLAVLLLHANEVVSADRLIAGLWGDRPPDTAAKALQGLVSQLRKLLGPELLTTEHPGYALRIDPDCLDAVRFEHLVAAARTAALAERPPRLEEALALWRGDALAEFAYDEFADAERVRLEELRLAALEARIDAELELGRHADVVGELEKLVSRHPSREALQGQLMVALYRCGRQAEALEVYRAARRALVDELGIEPGEKLRRLQRAILEQDPALAPPAQPEPTQTPLRSPRRRIAAALVAVAVAGGIAAAAVELAGGSRGPVAVALDSVAVVDPGTNRVEADVAVGAGPAAVAVGAGAVWVANAFDQTLSRIDPSTRKVTDTIGIGTDETDLAVGYGSVWVAGGNDGTLTRVDAASRAVLRRIPLGQTTNLLTDPVFAVAVGAGGVWATAGDSVVRIDPAPPYPVTRRIRVSRPNGVAVGGGSVWVTTSRDRILRFDAQTGERTATIAVPAEAIAPVVGGGQAWAIVRSQDGGRVWRLNAATSEVLGTTTGGDFPIALAFDGHALWAANENHDGSLWRIDAASDRVVSRVKVRFQLTGVAAADGAVWVTVQKII